MEAEMAKKDVKLTVMVDEPTMAVLSQALINSDVNLSELVRASILFSLPTLSAMPSLIKIIPTLPNQCNREMAR